MGRNEVTEEKERDALYVFGKSVSSSKKRPQTATRRRPRTAPARASTSVAASTYFSHLSEVEEGKLESSANAENNRNVLLFEQRPDSFEDKATTLMPDSRGANENPWVPGGAPLSRTLREANARKPRPKSAMRKTQRFSSVTSSSSHRKPQDIYERLRFWAEKKRKLHEPLKTTLLRWLCSQVDSSEAENIPKSLRRSVELGDAVPTDESNGAGDTAILLRRSLSSGLTTVLHDGTWVPDAPSEAKATAGESAAGPPILISFETFRETWDREALAAPHLLGMPLGEEEAKSLSQRLAHKGRGNRIDLRELVRNVMLGQPRRSGLGGVRCGPLGPGSRFSGRILSAPCKSLVSAPTNWASALAERCTRAPVASLELEYIHGYNGTSMNAGKILCDKRGRAIYAVAAVGIVFDHVRNTQKLFCGHNDDIKAIALHPNGQLVATGQVGLIPYICIWDSDTPDCFEEKRIHFAPGDGGVCCLSFTPDGRFLAAVGMDRKHIVSIWNWRSKVLLCSAPGYCGQPIQVYGLVFNTAMAKGTSMAFASFGVGHLRLWSLEERGEKAPERFLKSRLLAQSKSKKRLHCNAAVFLSAGNRLVSGHTSGKLLVWNLEEATPSVLCSLDAHDPGSGPMSGVLSLTLNFDGSRIITSGSDGFLCEWSVTKAGLDRRIYRLRLPPSSSSSSSSTAGKKEKLRRPAVPALSLTRGGTEAIVGTSHCDIYRVDLSLSMDDDGDAPVILNSGHAGPAVFALACSSSDSDIFASAGDGGRICIRSISERRCTQILSAKAAVKSLAFSKPGGSTLVAGLSDGSIEAFNVYTGARLTRYKNRTAALTCLNFSPTGQYLAVGSSDTYVDVLRVSEGSSSYRRISRCSGHSSTILHLDWSKDGSKIMSNSQSYEILYFDAASGSEIQYDQRDEDWESWTCKLGFPVMGLWESGQDGTDINAVSRSHRIDSGLGSHRYVVAANDNGKLRLLHYPSVIKGAASKSYDGHSSHVIGSSFTSSDEHVVSVGGNDRACFVWRVRGDAEGDSPNIEQDDDAESYCEPDMAMLSSGGGGKASRSRSRHKRVLVEKKMREIKSRIKREVATRTKKDIPRPTEVGAPDGKTWGPLDDSGKLFGWVVTEAQ